MVSSLIYKSARPVALFSVFPKREGPTGLSLDTDVSADWFKKMGVTFSRISPGDQSSSIMEIPVLNELRHHN